MLRRYSGKRMAPPHLSSITELLNGRSRHLMVPRANYEKDLPVSGRHNAGHALSGSQSVAEKKF